MRTTIDIPDATHRRLRVLAAREGQSVEALILQGVEHVLIKSPTVRVTLPIVRSKRPGALRIDSPKIYEVIGFP